MLDLAVGLEGQVLQITDGRDLPRLLQIKLCAECLLLSKLREETRPSDLALLSNDAGQHQSSSVSSRALSMCCSWPEDYQTRQFHSVLKARSPA
eukprot:5937646-Amphidinium_carterae.1